MRRFAMVLVVLGSFSVVGCAEATAPQVVTPYNAAWAAPRRPLFVGERRMQVATAPMPAPAASVVVPTTPASLPPPAKTSVEVEMDGVSLPVKGGETFIIEKSRMLFFYSKGVSPDCGNVKVVGLLTRPQIAGFCQIGFLPIEQGFKPGETRDAGISVSSGPSVAFRVKAL